jgi:hypothetical protein
VPGRKLAIIPEAWTPGLAAPLVAPAVIISASAAADLKIYAGKLRGRIVLIAPHDTLDLGPAAVERLDSRSLAGLAEPQREPAYAWKGRFKAWQDFRETLDRFLAAEGAIATIWRSPRAGRVIEATGYTSTPGEERRLPQLVMAAEDFSKTARRLRHDPSTRIFLDVRTRFYPERTSGTNVLAEIPGQGRDPEVVMVGAHLDSWHDATGAMDNGAGVAVVLEAARILRKVGARPRRTIRFALWDGEEQGLLGSVDYVRRHVATRPESKSERWPPFMQDVRPTPLIPLPGRERLRLYFNIDYGGGRIRGVYAPGTARGHALLAGWMAPLATLGVSVISPWQISESDDWSFADAGVATALFVQDPLDYNSRTHHSDLDTIDYARGEDLKQAAVVMATLIYRAACDPRSYPQP